MSMIRRGTASGRIIKIAEQEDGTIICSACNHIIFSQVNLTEGRTCPNCHNPVDELVVGDVLDDDMLGEGEDIAIPC